MEFPRKHSYDPNSFLVFAGFTLTFSTLPFIATEQYIQVDLLNLQYIFFVYSSMFCIVVCTFVHYWYSDYSSFLLEICEYLLYPSLAYFLLLMNVSADDGQQFQGQQSIIMMIMLIILTILIGIKVLFINQIYADFSYLQILSFRKIPRLYRILKILLISTTLNRLQFSEVKFVFILLNSIELIISFNYFSFTNIYLTYSVVVATGNMVLGSICLLADQYYSPYNLLIDLFIAIAYFSDIDFFKKLLEKQYIRELDKNLQRKNSEDILQQQILFLDGVHRVVRQQANFWSDSFKKFLQNRFIHEIYSLLIEEQHRNSCIKQLNDGIIGTNSLKKLISTIKTIHKMNNYNLRGTEATINEILKDKSTYQAYLKKSYDKNQKMNDIQESIAEFYISLTKNQGTIFQQCNIINFCIKCTYSQNILNNIRYRKIKKYLEYFINQYDLQSKDVHIIQFQRSLHHLSRQLSSICRFQLNYIDQLVGNTGKLETINKFLYKKNLKKKKIEKLFRNNMKKYPDFIINPEFCYLLLLFRVIYCQSLTEASEEIFRQIIIPKNNCLLKKQLQTEYPIILCEGYTADDKDVEKVLLRNAEFRKIFYYQQQNQHVCRLNISKMLPKQNRQQHFEAMIRAQDGQYDLQTHKQTVCLLKYNLNEQKIDILSKFKVSVHIFTFKSQSIVYICRLEKTEPISYVTQNCINQAQDIELCEPTIKKSIKTIKENKIRPELHFQLNTLLTIYRLQDVSDQIKKYTRELEINSNSQSVINGSESPYVLQDQQTLELAQIQHKLQTQESLCTKDKRKMFWISTFSLLIFFLVFIPVELFNRKLSETDQFLSLSLNYMNEIKTTGYKSVFSLLVWHGAKRGVFKRDICSKFGILDFEEMSGNLIDSIWVKNNNFYQEVYESKSENFKDLFLLHYSKYFVKVYNFSQIQYMDYIIRTGSIVGINAIYLTSADPAFLKQYDYIQPKLEEDINAILNSQIQDDFQQKIVHEMIRSLDETHQIAFILKFCTIIICFGGGIMLLISLKLIYENIYEFIFLLKKNWKMKLLRRKQMIEAMRTSIKELQWQPLAEIQFHRNGLVKVVKILKNSFTKETSQMQELADTSIIKKNNKNQPQQKYLKQSIQLTQILKLNACPLIFAISVILVLIGCFYFWFNLVDQFLHDNKQIFYVTEALEKKREILYKKELSNLLHLLSLLNIRYQFDGLDGLFQAHIPENQTYLSRIIAIADNQYPHEIMSKSIESLLKDSSFVPESQSASKQFSSYQINQAIPSLEKSQQLFRRMLSINNNESLNKKTALRFLCQNSHDFLLTLDPAMVKFNNEIYNDIFKRAQGLIIARILLLVLAVIAGLGFWGYQNYLIFKQLPKIKQQVLTLDTAKNMLKTEEYKPYLNHLLNPEG